MLKYSSKRLILFCRFGLFYSGLPVYLQKAWQASFVLHPDHFVWMKVATSSKKAKAATAQDYWIDAEKNKLPLL